jgi:hypothetical protein
LGADQCAHARPCSLDINLRSDAQEQWEDERRDRKTIFRKFAEVSGSSAPRAAARGAASPPAAPSQAQQQREGQQQQLSSLSSSLRVHHAHMLPAHMPACFQCCCDRLAHCELLTSICCRPIDHCESSTSAANL